MNFFYFPIRIKVMFVLCCGLFKYTVALCLKYNVHNSKKNAVEKNGACRLTQHRVATNLQF